MEISVAHSLMYYVFINTDFKEYNYLTVETFPIASFTLATSIVLRRICSCVLRLLSIRRNWFYKHVLPIRRNNNPVASWISVYFQYLALYWKDSFSFPTTRCYRREVTVETNTKTAVFLRVFPSTETLHKLCTAC